MRSGLWMSGSGGAGLIIARKADGTWSPPSGIILHTAELAFVMGVDVYDCLLVINSVQTLELFTRPRLILGADVSLAVGPLVAAAAADGSRDPEIRWKEISDTVLTYVKARGKHQAVQLDGSLVTERANENERFYCADVTILDILAGNIPKNVPEMRPLFEVIKAAEGRSDYDKALMDWLAQQPAPGDADIESPEASIASPTKQAFGLPDANDPDPFGVIGLEMAGIEIREAGTKLRPTSTQFEYHPSPTSPAYGRFSRQSMDTFVSRSNRGSCMSARTQTTVMTDACTQTDAASTADTSYSRANSDDGKDGVERLPTVVEPDEVDYTQVDSSVIEQLKPKPVEVAAPEPIPAAELNEVQATADAATATERGEARETKLEPTDQAASPEVSVEEPCPPVTDEQDEDADDEDDEEDEDEEPVICEVATASTQPTRSSIQTPQVTHVIHAKGAIVTIPKRIPPPLPARNPARASRGSKSDYGDVSSLRSPVRNSFLSVESRSDDASPAAERVSIDETIVTTQEEPRTSKPTEGSTLMQRPASPRHQKNSSSVCTAVAIDTTLQHGTSLSRDENENENENDRESLAVPPTPQTLDPGSSADDESEREPKTPQTAETDLDTASEHHRGEEQSRKSSGGEVEISASAASDPERGGSGAVSVA
ncbi:96700d68-aec8-48e7-a3b8-c7a3abbdf5ac [Thermothielavioides terrestris]|uniref:96700d68-aec8-48e7-a3b8-c7a3abbdf5ac n=1 Tax=Thermothielavioides terrestris TaxID=2587410 RepID=A0A3S4F5I2_9PEZI|nr:96700d68-aec8-48e7-a3b8-c7a3abbdf5ac [Thermothielavioides terrestris]